VKSNKFVFHRDIINSLFCAECFYAKCFNAYVELTKNE